MPQDTRLYKVESNGDFIRPKISNEALTMSGSNASSIIVEDALRFEIFNQNPDYIQLFFNDTDISMSSNGMYYNLNAFDYGMTCFLLNLTSPTVAFLPELAATDIDVNVPLVNVSTDTYTISSYTQYFSNDLSVNNLFLLRNQTTISENKIYRVVSKNAGTITVYDDSNDSYALTGKSSINSTLNKDQDYIFTRAKVVDSSGTSFYGLYNTDLYKWAKQTEGVKLKTADYGFTLDNELTNEYIEWSIFESRGIIPKQNDVLGLNISTNGSGSNGGKTSGLYLITKIAGGNVYVEPAYEPYVFIHQFFDVKYDYDLQDANRVWYVNPSTVENNTYIYGSQNFNFNKLNVGSSILSDTSSWAQQTGGKNDVVVGFSIFADPTENIRVEFSDVFKIGVYVPTWAENSINGLSVNVEYRTNTSMGNDGVIL